MENQNQADTAPVDRLVICFSRIGVSASEATEAIIKCGEAAAKTPFPSRKQLRLILMNAYRREWGMLRFFHPGWWDSFLSR